MNRDEKLFELLAIKAALCGENAKGCVPHASSQPEYFLRANGGPVDFHFQRWAMGVTEIKEVNIARLGDDSFQKITFLPMLCIALINTQAKTAQNLHQFGEN